MRSVPLFQLAGVMIALPFLAPAHEAAAEAPTYLGATVNQVNYYMYLPDDDHFEWMNQSGSSWNSLVDGEGWLIGYRTDSNGNPIRDRLPTYRNGDHEMGVLSSSQMVRQGFDTWESLGANGVNFIRRRDQGGIDDVIIENDTLVNPAIADDPVQHRKTLTHEFGHALGLSHDTQHFGLMYPGTFQQPPNYESVWYSRMYDMLRVRNLLQSVNESLGEPAWSLGTFTDMAVWSQTHENWNNEGSLLMTEIAPKKAASGRTLTLNQIHVENRGNQAADDVEVTVYLSDNPTITFTDHELGSFSWDNFAGHAAWSNGSVNMQVPADIPAGTYYVGMVLLTAATEISTSNNTAILTGDYRTDFDPILVTVTN